MKTNSHNIVLSTNPKFFPEMNSKIRKLMNKIIVMLISFSHQRRYVNAQCISQTKKSKIVEIN